MKENTTETMRTSYLHISSILLLVEGIFLPLFWIAHGRNTGPGSLGVYSLFGIEHSPHHNVFFLNTPPDTPFLVIPTPFVILLFAVFNSFFILKYYRHGTKWSWYVLLFTYLALIFPPTIGEAISRGIGAEYYIGPFYQELSLLGVIIPWVLFIPGILLGSGIIFGTKPESVEG